MDRGWLPLPPLAAGLIRVISGSSDLPLLTTRHLRDGGPADAQQTSKGCQGSLWAKLKELEKTSELFGGLSRLLMPRLSQLQPFGLREPS